MGSSHELPARADLEHLRNEAKQRLKELRTRDAGARLSDAQLLVAREYGFPSWRRLKAAVDDRERERVFAAARDGDLQAVRHALERGFNPGASDTRGRSLHQLAKSLGHTELELLMREYQERDERSDEVKQAVKAIQDAAADGRTDDLRRLLDEHPDLLDARGVDFNKQTALHKAAWKNRLECVRLLLERGADVRIRDYGDNAYALHFAAEGADLAIVRMLVEAGSEIDGEGDDHQVGVLGWATCLGEVREDVARYLLDAGAKLNIWSAIALDRADDVRAFVGRDPSILSARSSRNDHHRTVLHHAAAVNRPSMVRLLLELGARADATDDTGATALTVAAVEKADPSILTMLEQAGARLDLLTALTLGRYDLAERMLAQDPARIGPDGRDTIALHLLVAKRNADGVRWLIEHGVDLNAKRVLWDCNHTALHLTTELPGGAIELTRILLDAGADPDIRDDKYEATVLGWAEYLGQPQIAELLRQRGATT
jgi:ankyrin repeat protein